MSLLAVLIAVLLTVLNPLAGLVGWLCYFLIAATMTAFLIGYAGIFLLSILLYVFVIGVSLTAVMAKRRFR